MYHTYSILNITGLIMAISGPYYGGSKVNGVLLCCECWLKLVIILGRDPNETAGSDIG